MNKQTADVFRAGSVIVTLDQLVHGSEYPGGSVNSRTAYRDQDLEQLAYSLLPQNDGQLKPLLTCTHTAKPGVFFVFDGGRRQAGFALAIKKKLLDGSHPIEIKDFGQITPDQALQLSWSANEQVPLHPADRYAVFAKLHHQDGLSPAEIAKERGMTVKAVEQSLTFGGKLAIETLDAWRTGELTKDLAQVFTLAAPEDQVEQLAAMRKKHGKDWSGKYRVEDDLRKSFAGNERDAKRLLKFVGEAAYIAAGGNLTRDMFDDKEPEVVQDFKLLQKLARKKLKEKADTLIADGWSWADIQLGEHFYDHAYGASKDKKKAGCVVRISGASVQVKSGLTKRSQGTAGGGESSRPAEDPPRLDWDGTRALNDAHSDALAAGLAKDHKLALAALVAAISTPRGDTPLEINCGADSFDGLGGNTFRENLDKARKLAPQKLIEMLVQAAIAAVTVTHVEAKDVAHLQALVDETVYLAGLKKEINAAKIFKGANKAYLLAVIKDAFGADAAKQHATDGLDKLRKLAIEAVDKGWLPLALRTKSYAGIAMTKKGGEKMTTADKEHCRQQIAALDAAIEGLEDVRDDIIEQHDDLVAGRCAECDALLLHGDMGHLCAEGDPIFCADHAYTWQQVAEELMEFPEQRDIIGHLRFFKDLVKHLLGGGRLSDRMLHVL